MVISNLPDTFSSSDLVEEYEANRLNKSVFEVQSKVTTIRLPLEDLSILQAISDFYQETRQSVIVDFLHTFSMQFFCALPAAVRSDIAARADDILISELKQQCKEAGGSFDIIGGHWVSFAEIINSKGESNNG
jgi:hypothetical protein